MNKNFTELSTKEMTKTNGGYVWPKGLTYTILNKIKYWLA